MSLTPSRTRTFRPSCTRPLLLAILANIGEFKEHKAEAGFAIITDDTEDGMVDIHDRRPVMLSAEDART